MNSKNILVIFMFLIVLFSVSAVSAEEILETNDVSALCVDDAVEVMSVSESSQDWDDLKADVENENVSEIIYSGAGVVPTSQITFNHDLTVVGSSGSFIGNSNSDNITSYSFVPFISNSNVNINIINMTFRNMGNDILFQLGGNGNYTFENCVFENVNATGGKKSVIWFELGYGLVDNCTFSNCTTQYGTISNYHEGDVNAVHLTVKDSTFSDNYAGTSCGAINNCGQMTVINSTFNHNRAGWWAGAVHTHIGANTTIRKSRFVDNVAGWNGGALYTYGTLTLIDSDFIGNNCTTNSGGGAIGSLAYWGQTAPVVNIIGCNFTNNINKENSSGRGGAISFSGGTLNVYNTYFEGNDALRGTAINAGGLVDSNIVNNTFIRNTGVINGVDTLVLSGSYNLENNTYSDDTPMNIGIDLKAEFTFGDSVDCNIRTTSIYSDYIKTATYEVFVDGESYLNTTGTEFSVAVNDSNKHVVYVVLKGRDVRSNNVTIPLDAIYVSTTGSASGNGSASNPFNNINDAINAVNNNVYTIIVEEGTYYLSSSINVYKNLNIIGQGNVIFDGSLLSGNNLFNIRTFDYSFKNITFMNFNKPIIYYVISNINSRNFFPNVEFVNCIFKENHISSNMVIAYAITVENSKFINNTVSNGIFYLNKVGSTLNCVDSTFINNVASNNGAVFNGNNFVDADFSGCLFGNNSANNGAVIYVSYSSANVNVSDCVFLDNIASVDGNVITSNSPVVANNNWWGNTEYDYTIAPNVSSSVTVNNWLFLNETHIKISQDSEHIDLRLFNYDNLSNIISAYSELNIPEVNLVISLNNIIKSNNNLLKGAYSFNLNNLTNAIYNVSVNYYGHIYSFSLTFDNNTSSYVSVRVKNMKIGENAILVINTPIDATGDVIVNVNGVNTTLETTNGLIYTTIPTLMNLNEIVYNISVTYLGDEKYTSSSNSTFFMLCDDNSQWPMEGYNSRNTNNVPYYSNGNNVLWSVNIGGNTSNMVLDDDGNIYISNGTVIYAYNSQGVQLWNYSVIGYSIFSGLAISHNVIIASREGYGIYFINKFTGEDYSTANIWQGSSLYAPTVDEHGNIFISGEYQIDTGNYIFTMIYYDDWMFGENVVVVNLGDCEPIASPVLIADGAVVIDTTQGIILIDTNWPSIMDSIPLNCSTRSIVSSSGIIYGLDNGQLFSFDISNEECLTHHDAFGQLLALDENNNKIYIANESSIYEYDIFTNESHLYFEGIGGNITSMVIDISGRLFITTTDYTYSYAVSPYDFGIFNTTSLIINNVGNVYVIDSEGILYYCGLNTPQIVTYNNEPLLGISCPDIDLNDDILSYNNLNGDILSYNNLNDDMLGDELDESTWTYLNEFLLEYYDFFAYLEMTHPEINDIEDDDEFMEFVLSFTPKVLNENVGDIETITIPRAHYYAEVQDKLTIRSQAQAYEYVDDWWEPSQWFFLKYDGNNSVIDAKNSRSRIIGSDFNTSFSNFIFSNFNDYHSYFLIDENGPYANSKASVTSCTFINCTFVNCTRLFAYDNLQFINCHFIDCFTFYDPSMYENNNDIKTFYSSFCDLCIIVCGNNNRIVGCDFQISNGSFPIIYLKENTTISNNTFISSTPYAILLDSDKLNVDLKDNYIVSNINSSSIFLKIINSTDKVLTYSTNGTKLFGNDAIYIFDDTKVGSFSLGQYILEYNNNMNYPYKTNITTSLEDYNLIFTLNTTDNGNITLDDGTVIKVTGGKGSTPIAAAPGDTIQGTITGYLGEKYYALSSDYSLTVPKLSPNLNITTDELEFEYNQSAEIAIELESQTTKEANISIYDKDGKLVDSKLTKTTATFTDLAAGTYTLNVTYPGDDTYLNESVTDTLTITQATPELTLDVVNATATLEISITTNIYEDIIINVGGDEYKLNKDNTTFTLTNQAEGKYYVTATYGGNENYTSVSRNKTVTLSRADSNLEVSASVENNIVTITSTLTPTTGTITYIVNNKQYTKSIGEELIIDDLTPGNYTVFASYSGDLVYNPSNDNETFEIAEKTKADPKLELTVEDTLIKVTLNQSATGDVIITIGDISFIKEASTLITINASEYLTNGTYDVKVAYAGDEEFTNDTKTGSVTIPEEEVIEPKDVNLKLTVEDTVITVSLNDTATGLVIVTVGDISFVQDAGELAPIDVSEYLTNGTYPVEVTYVGDEVFANASETGELTIPDEPVVEPKDANLKVDVKDTVITVSLNDTATGLVIITVGDISFVQDAGELAPIDVSEYLTNGTFPVEVTYVGDDVFSNDTKTGEVTIPEEEIIEPKDANLKLTVEDTVITVSLNDTATGLVIVTVGDISFVQDAGELAPIDVSEYLTNGTFPVEVTYVGDDVFSNDTKTGELTVPSEPVVELKDPELKFVAFEDNEAIISLNKNATGLVLVSINGGWINNFYECDGNDIYIDVPDDSEPLTIDVVYLGDEIFKNATISFNVTYEAAELENANLKATVENTTITITVDKDATGYVYVDVDGKGFYAELNDGKAVIDVIGLGAGNYTASVTYAGDDNFANDSASVVISVSEESVENDTNVSEPVVPDMGVNVTNSTISVELPADATGYVLVDVNGTGYYAPVKDGKAVIDIIGLDAGSYPVNIMYVGDDKYSGSNATDTVVISKEEDKPAENESKPVDSEAKINVSEDAVSIELPEDATGYMLVDVDGTGYYVPVKDGKATLDLPELASGNHTVSVTYTGDKKYAPANSTQTVEVELKESIVSQDLTKVERAPDRFAATFLDENGNPLANANVTFDVNGAVYTRTTDANGESSIAINLIAGNYSITLTNPATGEVKTNNIVVLSRFAEDADLVKYYRNDSQYVLKLLDDDGNPAKAGEIVTYNINGVFYNRTTNATGHVQLNINLQPGEYVITAIYKGCQVAHKVTVLPVLTATDLTKKFGQSGAFEAKLVDGQGKAYAGKSIGFNINGVFYNRTTDDNGIAKLNINLLPGEYVITSSYGQALASNKVTVTA